MVVLDLTSSHQMPNATISPSGIQQPMTVIAPFSSTISVDFLDK